jgi:hypothetical protein
MLLSINFNTQPSMAVLVCNNSTDYVLKEVQHIQTKDSSDIVLWFEHKESGDMKRHLFLDVRTTYNSRLTAPMLNIMEERVLLPYPPERNNHE